MARSIHAQAAAQIRAELKRNNVKARVTCDSYTGGSSVRVELNDALPVTYEKVVEFVEQYQYGKFNGMEDIYENTNSNPDLPQVKFTFVENRYSDEMNQAAFDYAVESYNLNEYAGQKYKDLESTMLKTGSNFSERGYELISRVYRDSDFWKKQKSRIKEIAAI